MQLLFETECLHAQTACHAFLLCQSCCCEGQQDPNVTSKDQGLYVERERECTCCVFVCYIFMCVRVLYIHVCLYVFMQEMLLEGKNAILLHVRREKHKIGAASWLVESSLPQRCMLSTHMNTCTLTTFTLCMYHSA